MSKTKTVTTGVKTRKTIVNIIVHIILAALAFVWVLPVIWVILISFRAEKGAYVSTFFPKSYTFDNYIRLFTDRSIMDFPQMFLNTFIIGVCCCIVSTIFVLSVAYCMSRMRFKMRKPYMNIAMILGLFPSFMSMIAVYYILQAFELTNGSMIRLALIIVFSAGAGVNFYVAKGFFDTIPKSLDEAAIIDGATRWSIFTKVTIPLSKPIIVYTILTSFMGPWIDFVFAKVICRADATQFTVSIGLWNMLEKEYIYNWFNCFAAGAVVVSIPIAILFILTQKFYVEGMSGAVKG